MRFWKNPHMHRAKDAASRIPTRIWFVRVVGNHLDMVRTVFNIGGRLKNKIGVAIFSMTGFLTINDDRWMSIYSFKFKEDAFTFFKKNIEIFFVNVFTTSKERNVYSTRIVNISLCGKHTIIG